MKLHHIYKTPFIFMAIAGLMLLSCAKNELPVSADHSIILYFSGEVDAVPFSFSTGHSDVAEPLILPADTGIVRVFMFNFYDTTNAGLFNVASLQFKSSRVYDSLFSLNADLDETFQSGPKELATIWGSPANPFQLNTFTCEMVKNDGTAYTSLSLNAIPTGNISVDSTRDIQWFDEKFYKLIYLSMNFNIQLPDTMVSPISLTNGKALIAFPLE